MQYVDLQWKSIVTEVGDGGDDGYGNRTKAEILHKGMHISVSWLGSTET